MNKLFSKKGSGRKLKYGSITIIFSVLFIAAAVVLNIFAGVVTEKAGLRFDLTDSRIYEISDETVRFLQNELNEEIRITVLSSENYYIDVASYSPIREVLLRYSSLSGGKIKIDYVDPYVNPEVVSKYNTLGNINVRDIIIESDKRFKVLIPADLYAINTDYETEETYISGLQAEQKLSSAIMYCIIDELPKALRVQGHGESNYTELNSLLISGNYVVDTINLSVNDIPDDCEMLIIAAPKSDFTVEEVEKLDNYFDRKGNAMVFYDISVPELPVFERFMSDWGVRYEKVLVADSQQMISHPTNIAPSLMSHGMTESIYSTNQYVIVPSARAITLLYQEQGWRTTSGLLVSSSASYGKMISDGATISTYTKESGDLNGPFQVCVISEQNVVKNLENNYSRILFCSSGMAANSMLQTDAFLNSRFFVQAINYMNESAEAILVEPKYYTSTQLNILGSQASAVFWFMCVIIPAGTLALGIGIWVKRRNM
jgi:hypothetical protein